MMVLRVTGSNKLPFGQLDRSVYMYFWEAASRFPHLMFSTCDFRTADSKSDAQGQARAALRQPWKHQPVREDYRSKIPTGPHVHLQHCQDLPLSRDNADNYVLCAPSHLSTASSPVETHTRVMLFTCHLCATLLSTTRVEAEVPTPQKKQKSIIASSHTHQPLTLSTSPDSATFIFSPLADGQTKVMQESIRSAAPETVQ